MSQQSSSSSGTQGLTRLALIAGLVGLVVAGAGYILSGPGLFFQAYLFAFLFWLGISLGSLAILLLHLLTGGRWGLAVRRITEAAAGTTWVMAILFVPLALGLSHIYPWTQAGGLPEGAAMQFKASYLSTPFFLVRAIIYFAAWIGLAGLANRAAARTATSRRPQGFSAAGLIIYLISMTFASIDWLMSLQPDWTSTAFGLITVVGQVLTALAFAVLILNLLPGPSQGRRWNIQTTPIPYKDLGALMLTFVLGWAYLAYFQLLIIWGGNIPREVTWYLARSEGGWDWVIWVIAVLQFILPFLILLSVRARHNLRVLAGLGGMLLFSYLLNLFWHVKPAFSPGRLALSWLDIVLPLALGGIWLAGFFFTLGRRPALTAEEELSLEASLTAKKAVP